jgi:SnoaL-like polyketide cyclase
MAFWYHGSLGLWTFHGINQTATVDPMHNPTDLERFFEYARGFELAYVSDDFSGLVSYFTEDAGHEVIEGGPFGAGARGGRAVVADLRDSVARVDRRFDVRIPETLEGPTQRCDGVWMRYALTLRRRGLPDLRVEGEHLARYAAGRIASIEERLAPGSAERVTAYLAEHGPRLKPAGAPFAPPIEPADHAALAAAITRTLVRAYGSAKSAQDIGAALALCSDDFTIETTAFEITSRDRADTAEQLGLFFHAFPDYGVSIDGLATGDGVVTCWGRARMTFAGAFLGTEPTGRTAAIPFFCVFGCDGMQLRYERFFFDRAALCEGIGVPVERLSALLRQVRAASEAA